MWGFLRWNRRVEKVLILLGFLSAGNIQRDIDSHRIRSHRHGCTTIYNKTTITKCKYNARPICPSREGQGAAVRAGRLTPQRRKGKIYYKPAPYINLSFFFYCPDFHIDIYVGISIHDIGFFAMDSSC